MACYRRVLRWSAALALAVSSLLWSEGLSAQTRVVVGEFTGHGAARIRNEAVRALNARSEVDLVRAADMEAAVERLGHSLDSPSDYAAVAAEIEVSAIVTGQVARRGRTVQITVRGGDGVVVGDATFQARTTSRLRAAVRRGLWVRLGGAVQSAPASSASGATPPGGEHLLVVLPFEGPSAARVRGSVLEGLEVRPEVMLMPVADAQAHADGSGLDLTTAEGRVAVAQALGIAAWVEGEVNRRGRRRYRATVRVLNGLDGLIFEEATFSGRNINALQGALRQGTWDRLGASIEAANPPPTPSEDPEPEDGVDEDHEEQEYEDDDADEPSGPLPSPLSLVLDLRAFHRSYSYNDDIFGQLRGYELTMGPSVAGEIVWYPGAHVGSGPASMIGVALTGETAFLIQSKNESGDKSYPTRMMSLSAGLRGRFPVDEHAALALIDYGMHSFRIEAIDVDNPAPEVPDVDYSFVRIGAGTRLHFSPLSVELRLAYLHLLSTGQLESDAWFPRSSGTGLEASVAVGYEVIDGLEVRLGGHLRRYFFSLEPEPGDPWIAGGAVDQYLAGTAGVAWHM